MKIARTFAIQLAATIAIACGGPQKLETAPATVTAPSASPMASGTVTTAPTSTATTQAAAPGDSASTAVNATPLIISIEPRSESKLKGTAKFEASSASVQVTLDVTGAPPGKHGAHIHQNADCSAKDGKSAGDHFNPASHEHGLPPAEHRHLGDLGNLEVGKDGKGHVEITILGANLTPGDKMSFLDRGIIIHEKIDDGGQPSGNAGKRIGCGEIKR